MKLGVLLLNLGGPASLEEVKPFLVNLFSDPDTIPVPFSKLFQKPVAWLLATSRKKLSQSYYQAIGGGSPLQKITKDQALALEERLKQRFSSVKVYVGMRYSNPFIKEAWAQIKKDQISHLIILPLYPHYSVTTTGSAYKQLQALMFKDSFKLESHVINSWCDHPLYIEACVEKILAAIHALPSEYQKNYRLVFSAHSIPVKFIEQGDPYQHQIKQTIELILKNINFEVRSEVSYQSKLGPIRWLEPSTLNLLKTLSQENPKPAIVMVPISFVSDHVETLYEIDLLYQKEAKRLGLPYLARTESLNLSSKFIAALEDLVIFHVGHPREGGDP